MPWLVVKFHLENTVEAVPKSWYCDKTFTCYWPPDSCGIEEKIKNQHTPDRSLWETYPAIILGQYDDLKTATKKANKARTTNVLSSHNEDIKKKRIPKKQKNKSQKKQVSDIDTSLSLDDNSSDSNTYPSTYFLNSRKNSVDGTCQVVTVHEQKDIEKNRNNVTNSALDTNPIVATEDDFSKNQWLHTKYYEQLLKEINLLHLKVNDILDSINIIVKKAKVNNELLVNNDTSEVFQIIHLFPMNEESLNEVENWIATSVDNRIALTKELSRLGGSTVKELIKRIMCRILLNEVGMLYSWEGAKKKKIFKHLKIAGVILDVVRKSSTFQNVTEVEVINHIKSWLVRSKDRYLNSKKKTNEVTTNEERNIHDEET